MENLAGELLIHIFEDESLSNEDLKSLRLVCRSFVEYSTNRLFRRIALSKLKRDHDAFFNVAARPHLAKAVRVLVWYELGAFEMNLHALGPFHTASSTLFPEEPEPDDAESIFFDINSQFWDAFWIPSWCVHSPHGPKRPHGDMDQSLHSYSLCMEEFWLRFHKALEAMDLDTVISQPMHPLRSLVKSPTGYPLTAQLLMCSNWPPVSELNDGFHSILGPAMMHLSRINKPITRLYFADEGHSSSIKRLDISVSPAFSTLTHIDLCISKPLDKEDVENLGLCLRAATNLTDLTLCIECSESWHYWTLSPAAEDHGGHTFDVLLGRPDQHWPRLRSLHLDDVLFRTASFLKFVEKHSTSLESLWINRCKLTGSVVTRLAAIDGLKLKQFIAPSPKGDIETFYISEARLLAFVNNGEPDAELRDELSANEYMQVRTHYSVFDVELSETAAICDTRYDDALERGYTISELSVLDSMNGDVRDREGYAEEDYGCVEGPAEEGSLGMDDKHDDNDREYASHLKRLHEAPHWMWGRSGNGIGEIYYWKVTPEDGETGMPTEIWRFQHRNGEVAFGDDPLEFWEDWEGSEAGDIYEGTPYGTEFQDYLLWQDDSIRWGKPCNIWKSWPEDRLVRFIEGEAPEAFWNLGD